MAHNNNEQNLIPFNERTEEEVREIARRGGIKSGEARRKKRTMLDTLDKTIYEVPKLKQNPNNELTYQELATLGLIQGAMKGYSENYKIIKEMMEEKEKKEEQELNKTISIPAKDMPRSFVDLYRDILDRKYYEYWLEGGRGSDKSSMWSEIVTELLENNPNMCALLIRKVANTLKDSVYSQMQWGIDKLGETYPEVPTHWKATKSPLEMVNEKTGQIIYFRGADDPGKIKSIKPPKGKYIGIVVYEEFDQMNGMEEVGTIDRSVVRGGEDFIVFRVYNTPRSSLHFVNVEKKVPKADRLVHRSDYRDVPVKWLGQKFIDEAEYMKSVNEKNYDNIYLGLETGTEGTVFENLEVREIPDSEIETFDYIYYGLDWGYFPDPLAYIKCCYNSAQQTLYIYDEFVVNKMSNEKVWNYLQEEKGVTGEDLIIADSAEPKSIGDFKSYGALIKGAEKGKDSVPYSMKWLQSLAKIVIDPVRCPNATREFSTYELEQDKDGNYITSYPDKNNHTIDATRYALNNIWKKKGQ